MTREVRWRTDMWTLRSVLRVFLMLSAGSVMAQGWVKTTAPHTNWVSIACSADGTNVVAASSGNVAGPIFISKDSGNTWTQTPSPILGWKQVASSADGKTIFGNYSLANGGSRLWASTNGGSTWSTRGYLTNAYLISSSAGGNTIVAAGGGFPYLAASQDGGLNWTYTTLPVSTYPQGFVVSADGTRLMACVMDPSSTFLWMYTSTDSGQTWTANPGPDPSSNWGVAFAGAANATTLVVAVNELGQFTSPDWGQTWQVRVPAWQGWPAGIPCCLVGIAQSIASSADGSKLMLSSNGSVYGSTDSGVSWFKTDAPGGGSLVGSADGSKFFLLAGGDIYRFDATVPPPAVQLRIAQVQNTFLLSWDVPSTASLQESDDLSGTNWVPVSAQPVVTNGQLQVTVEASALGRSFYRLSQP